MSKNTIKVTVEDRLDISDLLARYCFYVDEGMTDEWLGLWEEDGVFFGTRNAPVVGHESLRLAPAQTLGGGMRHYITNVFMDYGDSQDEIICGSACKKDPVSGVIGV